MKRWPADPYNAKSGAAVGAILISLSIVGVLIFYCWIRYIVKLHGEFRWPNPQTAINYIKAFPTYVKTVINTDYPTVLDTNTTAEGVRNPGAVTPEGATRAAASNDLREKLLDPDTPSPKDSATATPAATTTTAASEVV